MHHDHQPISIVFPLQLPNTIFTLWFSLYRNNQIFITFVPPPLPSHVYISIFFLAAPTPPPQHLYNYIVFPVQPPPKICEGLHALTISLLCTHVSGSEGKSW